MLAIRGRVKTMILGPGGENIYPETIETIINNLNFVEESLVVPENGGLLALVKIDVNLMAESMKISIGEAKEEAQADAAFLLDAPGSSRLWDRRPSPGVTHRKADMRVPSC